MRAKFKVDSVRHFEHTQQAVLSAVTNGSQEDNDFAAATPSGNLSLDITAPEAQDFFLPGKSYYMDFTLAPEV
jgi:hypothetical protein